VRVYQSEKDAGVDFQLNEAGSLSAFVTAKVQIRDIKEYFDGMSVADLMEATQTVQSVEELLGQEQPDLALVVAILVSTGWNKNDDIFTPDEVWKAKSSPMNKPMNDNHDEEKILGHIVQSRALDKSGNEIVLADNESPPDEFDIEVAGVLYRAFPKLRERIDEIIAKAKSGEMFVSMEAWFPDFGYGLIDPATGETKLIERTEETAFLTKHLRIYGGCGEYQDFKIGRHLKDIIFGAQGFVDEPANPDSVIKKVAAKKNAASSVFVTAELSELPEGGVEDVDEKEMKELQTKLDEAQASLEGKEKEVTDLQKAAEDFKAKDYEGQIATLTAKVEELNAGIAKTSEKTEVDKVELQKQLTEVTERAEKSDAELDEIRKTETARERFAKLSEVKKITDEKATLADLRGMSEETFVAVLNYAGQSKSEGTEKTAPEDNGTEQAEAVLGNVDEKEKDDADFNANETVVESNVKRYASLAGVLTGRAEKKD